MEEEVAIGASAPEEVGVSLSSGGRGGEAGEAVAAHADLQPSGVVGWRANDLADWRLAMERARSGKRIL